jgi:hypothetical protein
LKEGELPTKPKTTRKPRAKKENSNNDWWKIFTKSYSYKKNIFEVN